jgi:hypothetical protein
MPGDKVRFAIIGVDHNHTYNHARLLLDADAELPAVSSDEPEEVAAQAEARRVGVELPAAGARAR